MKAIIQSFTYCEASLSTLLQEMVTSPQYGKLSRKESTSTRHGSSNPLCLQPCLLTKKKWWDSCSTIRRMPTQVYKANQYYMWHQIGAICRLWRSCSITVQRLTL